MRIYLDACTLIDAVERSDLAAEHMRVLFHHASNGKCRLVTSELTLSEVIVQPLAQQDRRLLGAYLKLLSNDPDQLLAVSQIDRNVLAQAAFIRVRQKSIKLPDAIHIATAERLECTNILTRDLAWRNASQLPILIGGSAEFGDLLARL